MTERDFFRAEFHFIQYFKEVCYFLELETVFIFSLIFWTQWFFIQIFFSCWRGKIYLSRISLDEENLISRISTRFLIWNLLHSARKKDSKFINGNIIGFVDCLVCFHSFFELGDYPSKIFLPRRKKYVC